MIALMTIATGGERYTKFVKPLVESAKEYFPKHDFVLFSDENLPVDTISIYQPDLGWPDATLMRYHAMMKARALLSMYDHVFYIDVDCLFVNKIEPEEILADGLTVVTHPGFPDAFERRPESRACVTDNPTYYQGCFVGGSYESFMWMCHAVSQNIDEDAKNGVMAKWHDESHLNWFCQHYPPSKVLTPAYAYPEEHYLRNKESWWTPDTVIKIRHLEKTDQGKWKNG